MRLKDAVNATGSDRSPYLWYRWVTVHPLAFFVLGRIQLPQVARVKEFREQMLPDDDEEEEEEREQDSRHRYPCHPPDDQQINQLEKGEGQYLVERHRLQEGRMGAFKNPVQN